MYDPFEYSPAQRDIFFDGAKHGRYRIHPKGRRLGATRGAAHAMIEFALWGYPLMWGDVTQANLDRYVERYFIPAMKKRSIEYRWSSQKKTLRIGQNGGYIDFRSKERPENWEGFGYQVIFINEAGIVLDDDYLYYNAVLPMLMDYPNSQLIAAGTPKGKNIFRELYHRALAGEPGYYGKTYTSWDNPWLPEGEVQRLIDSLPPEAVRQEVYGEFVDVDEGAFRVIPREWLRQAVERWKASPPPTGNPTALGLDPARGGKDKTVIASRWGSYIGRLEVYPGKSTPDGPSVAALAMTASAQTTQINVDVIGIGSSVYDHIKGVHDQVAPINGSAGSKAVDKSKQFGYRNLRSQLFWQLREHLDPTSETKLCLPPDEEMIEELAALSWKLVGGNIYVNSKDEVKDQIGRSPDKGDAVAYSLYTMTPRFTQVVTRKPKGWYG